MISDGLDQFTGNDEEKELKAGTKPKDPFAIPAPRRLGVEKNALQLRNTLDLYQKLSAADLREGHGDVLRARAGVREAFADAFGLRR